ncbi:MAG: hypothetical protein ACQEW0_17485 [Pseudomonadota bacterium]
MPTINQAITSSGKRRFLSGINYSVRPVILIAAEQFSQRGDACLF